MDLIHSLMEATFIEHHVLPKGLEGIKMEYN